LAAKVVSLELGTLDPWLFSSRFERDQTASDDDEQRNNHPSNRFHGDVSSGVAEVLRIQCTLKVQKHQPDECRSPGREKTELSVDRGFSDSGQSAGLISKLVQMSNGYIVVPSLRNPDSHVVASEPANHEYDAKRHRQELKSRVHLKSYRSPKSDISLGIKNRCAKTHSAPAQRHA
jgi:hypothetical protein